MSISDWFQDKKVNLLQRGCIYRYHIIDTSADEWNSLSGRNVFFLDEHDSETCQISKRALKELGVKMVIKYLGIWWLIRFNA